MPLVSTFGNLSARAFGLGAYRSSIFSPSSLFAAGEQGVWYDPSDLTTMFEDSVGTTAVHTPGNGVADSPIGLLLDKHSGAVGTNGAARYNLSTYTEDFTNAAWTKYLSSTVTANSTTAPDGTSTADTLTLPSGGPSAVYNTVSTTANLIYTASVSFKKNTHRYGYLNFARDTNNRYAILIDLDTGLFVDSKTKGSPSNTSYSITNQGNGWYRLSISASSTGTASYMVIQCTDTIPITVNADVDITNRAASGSVYIWGADLRLSSQAALTPTYQPITSSWAATMAGNHATQATSTARPTLSARYNLLTYSEQFNNAYWSKTASTISADATTAPDGTTTADAMYETTANDSHYAARLSFGGTANYTCSVCLKAGTRTWAYLFIYSGSAFTSYVTYFDLQNGVVGNNPAGTTASITSLGNGWYRCSITRNDYWLHVGIGVTTGNGAGNYVGDTTKYMYIWGADCRLTNDGVGLPVYQRIADANTYDSTGFPYYIKSDGVDDSEATSAINFTGTNKITVFAGIRKLSDSAQAVVAELSATIASNNGTFLLSAPNSAAANLNFSSKGTTQVDNTVTTYTSPITNVITGIGDISAPNNQIRVNGSVAGTQTGSQGTGNYGNFALYLFRRNSASLPFNGRTYGLIIRGASSTATEIANTETWLNGKTKAY